jgi:hypothetical protein
MSQTGKGHTGSPASTRRIGFWEGSVLTDRAHPKEKKIESSLLLFLLEAESWSRNPVHRPYTKLGRSKKEPGPGADVPKG